MLLHTHTNKYFWIRYMGFGCALRFLFLFVATEKKTHTETKKSIRSGSSPTACLWNVFSSYSRGLAYTLLPLYWYTATAIFNTGGSVCQSALLFVHTCRHTLYRIIIINVSQNIGSYNHLCLTIHLCPTPSSLYSYIYILYVPCMHIFCEYNTTSIFFFFEWFPSPCKIIPKAAIKAECLLNTKIEVER